MEFLVLSRRECFGRRLRSEGQAIRGLLFGVQPADHMTIAAVAMVLLAVGVACLIPAGRAARTDVITALRIE